LRPRWWGPGAADRAIRCAPGSRCGPALPTPLRLHCVPSWPRWQPLQARGAARETRDPSRSPRGAEVDQTSSQIRVKARCCLPQPRLVNVRATIGNFEGPGGSRPRSAVILGAAFTGTSRSGSVVPSGRRRGRVKVAAGLVMGQSGPRDGTEWRLLGRGAQSLTLSAPTMTWRLTMFPRRLRVFRFFRVPFDQRFLQSPELALGNHSFEPVSTVADPV
jgi:hypothetical protein